MERSKVEYAFNGIWARCQQSIQEGFTLEQVRGWAKDKGLAVVGVERRYVGAFGKTECIVVNTEQGGACFPVITEANDASWRQKSDHHENIAKIWKDLEWFSPLWISTKDANNILRDAGGRTAIEAIHVFNYHTSTLYNLSFEAVCIEQIMGSAACLVDVQPLAREAFLAFYAGYKSASIAALIPAIEGAISRILPVECASLAIMEKVNRVVEGAIGYAAELHYEGMWVPDNYKDVDYLFCMDERVFAFETFRRWLQNSFYKNTSEYNGAASLNRHLFAHGLSPEWQKASLSRLIVAISTIGVIESWFRRNNSVSLFFPVMNKDSELLWQQAILHGSAQMVVKTLEEKHYHEYGRSVPIVPTDDGATLRKALLMEECIDDLVRPLRNAGWGVEFADVSSDLYVKVVAKSDRSCLRIALLYSCGTENSLYKELEKDCDVILYRGAPYLQEQFAAGVALHVGPVTGWQPPSVI